MVRQMGRERRDVRGFFQADGTFLTRIISERLRDTSKILDLRFRDVSMVLVAQMVLKILLTWESQRWVEATDPDLSVLRLLVL